MDHGGGIINDTDDKVSLSNELIKDEISSCDSIDLDTEEEKACSVSGENRDLIHSDVVSKVLEDEVIKVLHKDVRDEKHLSSSSSSCVIDVKENLDGEWVCRICHLDSDQSLEATSTTVQNQRELIQLGCGCKDELGVAHSYCGEAWFKIKGNRLCEICGETATNITGIGDDRFLEEWNDRIASGNGIHSSERSGGGCWSGQPFCNFLMACLVIAFVLPWFFRVSMF